MKNLSILVTAMTIAISSQAQHTLEKLWQSDSVLTTPESVRFDPKSKTLYVSNIGDFDKPGSGSISKLDINGKVIANPWIKGLTAAKGMALHNNMLYAAEQNTVAVIDVKKSTIVKRITIDGAEMLNDISVDAKGVIYVTDSRTGKVHKIEKGTVSVFLEGLKGLNGVLWLPDGLYVLAGGSLVKHNTGGNAAVLASGMEGGTDGVELVKENEFIVSCWGGVIYYVKADGTKEVLMDTRDKGINAADIGYDAKNRIVYVPTFRKNSVVAYLLK